MSPWAGLVVLRAVLATFLVPGTHSQGVLLMRNGGIDIHRAAEFDFAAWKNRRGGSDRDALRTWLLAFAAPGPNSERHAEVAAQPAAGPCLAVAECFF